MASDQNGSSIGSPMEQMKAAAEAVEYWTEERRAAAKPYPMPKVPAGGHGQAHELPESEPGHTAHGHGVEKDVKSAVSPHSLGAPVANPLIYPFRTVGKIFFNQAGGGFSASAAMVAPNVLLTAGHCVWGSGQWSTNMVFYPSYGKRAANDPLYKIACGRLSCQTIYTKDGDRAHDFAMAWMPTGPGNTIGWLGLAWGQSTAGRTWEAVGYPATPNPPFNGNVMDASTGTVAPSSTAGTIGLTNDNMEHGSSGGPWITAVGEAAPTHANGLQSFHIHDGDTVEYGPYFTSEVKTLFDYISNPANH